jgi:hypothetical protein
MSLRPLPAINRCRFFRYDVFFFGTAFSMPSQISPSDGNEGKCMAGIANAANGVGNVRNGCARRCRNGRFRTGRTGPLTAGSSVCHSGGSGRASAMVMEGGRKRWDGTWMRGWVYAAWWVHFHQCWNKLHPGRVSSRALPRASLARRFVAAPFPAAATPQESCNVPGFSLEQQPSADRFRVSLSHLHLPRLHIPAPEAHTTHNGRRLPDPVYLSGQLCRFRQHHQAD